MTLPAGRTTWAVALSAAFSAALAVGVVAAVVLMSPGRVVVGEESLVRLLDPGSGPGRDVLQLLTELGSGAVLYPVLLVLAVRAYLRGDRAWTVALPLLLLAGAQAVEAVGFATFSRPSPTSAADITFSSGRAMAAVLGWGLVARQLGRAWAWPLAALLAAGAGVSRVALGLHWPTDVVAGWLFGLAALALADLVLRREALPTLAPRVLALRGSRWAWAAAAAAALVPLVPLVLVSGPERMKDLLVYVGAGATAGRGADVYDFRSAFDMPFTYPPAAALLSEPLSRVPLGLLHLLWVAATLAALVAVARLAMAPVVTRLGLPLTLTLLLLSSPVRSHLRFGQVGLFLVLLVAADLLRDRRRQGIGLGVAIAVKLTPAVFLPWLLITRKLRPFTLAVGTAAAATLSALLLLWPSAQEYLWRALWDSDRFGANDVPGNQSVRGMLLRTDLDERSVTLLWLAAAVVLAVLAVRGAHRLEQDSNRLGALGVLAALSIAISPISWVHHLVFLVLPLSALVAAGRARIAAGWAVLLIVSLPSLGSAGLRGSGPELFWQLVVNGQGLTAVAACLWLPRLLRRTRATTDETNRSGARAGHAELALPDGPGRPVRGQRQTHQRDRELTGLPAGLVLDGGGLDRRRLQGEPLLVTDNDGEQGLGFLTQNVQDHERERAVQRRTPAGSVGADLNRVPRRRVRPVVVGGDLRAGEPPMPAHSVAGPPQAASSAAEVQNSPNRRDRIILGRMTGAARSRSELLLQRVHPQRPGRTGVLRDMRSWSQ